MEVGTFWTINFILKGLTRVKRVVSGYLFNKNVVLGLRNLDSFTKQVGFGFGLIHIT